MTKGERILFRALMIPFLAIYAKGGESMSPKAKEPHHHLILKEFLNLYDSQLINFKLVFYCVQKGEKSSFSKLI
jgi:hypothetical protein